MIENLTPRPTVSKRVTNKTQMNTRRQSARHREFVRQTRIKDLPPSLTKPIVHAYLATLGGLWRERPFGPRAFWAVWGYAKKARLAMKLHVPDLLDQGIVILPHPIDWQSANVFYGFQIREVALLHRLTIDLCDWKLRQSGKRVVRVIRYPIEVGPYDEWRNRHGRDSKAGSVRAFHQRCLRKVWKFLTRGEPLPPDLILNYTPPAGFDTPRPLPQALVNIMQVAEAVKSPGWSPRPAASTPRPSLSRPGGYQPAPSRSAQGRPNAVRSAGAFELRRLLGV